jgi:hypothetical protein
MKALKSGKKPANQGSAGKANVASPRKSGVPKAAKPGASKMMLGKQPSGTRGGKAPKRAGK